MYRINEIESPTVRRLTTDSSVKAMKLWTPIPAGPRKRAATIDWMRA